MVRDVALLVSEDQDAGSLIDALRDACGPLATGISLFDIYRGEGIAAGRKSLAFSVVYRAADRTLTDDEVDGVHRAAVESITSRFDAVVR